MKKNSKSFTLPVLLVLLLIQASLSAYVTKQKDISSPSGRILVSYRDGDDITLMVKFNGQTVLTVENPGLVFKSRKTSNAVKSMKTRNVNQIQLPLIREKRKVVTDHFNELTVIFRDQSGLIIRVYDDGFAYRFFTQFQEDTVRVINETASIRFSLGDSLYLPVIKCRDEKNVDCYHTSFEEDFIHAAVSDVSPAYIAYLPIYASNDHGASIAITESDLHDYPGMFVTGSETDMDALNIKFPAYPLETSIRGDYFKQELVTKRADYIAITAGKREYPWRVFVIGEQDKDLVNSDMVYRLASPSKIDITDWIKPGKITDEWITNSILYNVDFKSGINTQTYKYYIDFASRFGMQYIFMDAGWSDIGDFSKINPEVDLPEIIAYAASKQVGVWLWTSALTLKNNMYFLEQFSRWGIKGIMVDFMDREDQLMVRFQETVARETSKNRLMLLFHGASKPTGLRKTYPNVIIREGVMGHEYDKWSDRLTPEHNLIIPFTRMIAGPLDYEGGGMINAQKNAFRIVDPVPMTQGTRMHQLAMYVVYESPLQYLAGNISDYLREPEYATFYSKIPCVWDETIVLHGKISDYILVARKSGNDWWVAAMTDWTPRTLEVDLSFLGTGQYAAEIYSDGINSDVYASDYKRIMQAVTSDAKLQIKMAPGGGWVAHFNAE